MKSEYTCVGSISLPLVNGEFSMIPFCVETFSGLPEKFKETAKTMLQSITNRSGTAYFTIHGKKLKQNQTLRRGGPHTDGNYEPYNMTFGTGGGNGWKVGEDGPGINTALHHRQYVKETGGIILASNFEACLAWNGEYDGLPNTGGDCSHIKLDQPTMLERNKIYYGNNHFIHESLPMSRDVHRVMARITLPENHVFEICRSP